MSPKPPPRVTPRVNLGALAERKTTEAELFSLDSQLRNFTSLRDRLSAEGCDANDYYRQLLARRDTLVQSLRVKPQPALPPAGFAPPPLAIPGRVGPGTGPGLGTSGIVQVGVATDGVNVIPSGPYPIQGEIIPIPGGYPGDTLFAGQLSVGPENLPANTVIDWTIKYFWLRTWKYIIDFPPAAGPSLLHLWLRYRCAREHL